MVMETNFVVLFKVVNQMSCPLTMTSWKAFSLTWCILSLTGELHKCACVIWIKLKLVKFTSLLSSCRTK